jgi:hypothetical protein
MKNRRAFARGACRGAASGRLLARIGLDLQATTHNCRIARSELEQKGYRPVGHQPTPADDDARDDDLGGGEQHEGFAEVEDDRQRELSQGLRQAEAIPQPPPPDTDRERADVSGARGLDLADGVDHGGLMLGDSGAEARSKRRHAESQQSPAEDAKRARLSPPAGERLNKRGRQSREGDLETDDEDSAKRMKAAEEEEEVQTEGVQGASPAAEATPGASSSTATPSWLPSSQWGVGHNILLMGPAAFCSHCGCYAIDRVGVGLIERCRGVDKYAQVKVQRLAKGLHPITGARLVP